jgi:hypothetical protein
VGDPATFVDQRPRVMDDEEVQGSRRRPHPPMIFSLLFPWPIGVIPSEPGCTKAHTRVWEASRYAAHILHVMELAGWTDLSRLAAETKRPSGAMHKLLSGWSTMGLDTLLDWHEALAGYANAEGAEPRVAEAIGQVTNAALRTPEPRLWRYRNRIYRWPTHPRTHAAEWAVFIYPLWVADILTEIMLIEELPCICHAIEIRRGWISGRERSIGHEKCSEAPWMSTTMDIWESLTSSADETPLSLSQLRNVTKTSPEIVVQNYMRAIRQIDNPYPGGLRALKPRPQPPGPPPLFG